MPDTDTAEKPWLSKRSIEERIESIQKATEFDESTKAELIKRYKAALDWIDAAEEAARQTAQYQAEIAGASELFSHIKTQLATPLPEPPVTKSPGLTLQQLEKGLAQAESQLRDADSELAGREDGLKRRGERRAELAKRTDDARQRVEGTKKLLASSPGNGESAELAAARRVEIEARLEALKNQLRLYQVEAQRHDASEELLPIQRDLARRKRNQCEKTVIALQQEVAAKRRVESERQAREARWDAANAQPALRQLAERNAELAERHKRLAESITKTANEVNIAERQRTQLAQDYKKVQEKVRYVGNSSSIGLLLKKKKDELPDVRKCEDSIRFVAREMPDANLTRIGLEANRESSDSGRDGPADSVSAGRRPTDSKRERE